MKSDKIFIYDTTLRDGTQGENISFTAEEKLDIALKLDDIGADYIEGGWPGTNPNDDNFFKLTKQSEFKSSKIAAFGSTRKPLISANEDKNLADVLSSKTPVVTLFGKSWKLLLEKIMQIGAKENLSMIRDSISYVKSAGRETFYDAEHFFDGFKDDPDYAVDTVICAAKAGADAVFLCDTNGGTLPNEIELIMSMLKAVLKRKNLAGLKIGIHPHNDCGLATANTIAAVRAGATIVQGTINGYGERCGNADLTSVIPVLVLKMNKDCISYENLSKLKRLSRFVSETANIVPLNSRPFVGESAFSHKGGVHVDAITRKPEAYEHIDPELVGNQRRVLISDLSGRSSIKYKARELDIDVEPNDYARILSEVKKLEKDGLSFDSADGSFKIFLQKMTGTFKPVFELESFRVTIEKDKNLPCSAHATVKISVNGKKEITAAEGYGPVSALDNALRKALGSFFPVNQMRLVDFKVRVIDGREGTAAKVRVHIDSRDSKNIWSTVGFSEDIIEASWFALADSFQHFMSYS